MKAIGLSLLWVTPYLIGGFSAPLIFRNAPTPQVGGRYAGALFIFAGFWAVFLAFRHQMPFPVKVFLLSTLCLQILFWGWRFSNSIPLKESVLLGIPGSSWHGILTSLYLLGAIGLLFFEIKKRYQLTFGKIDALLNQK